MVEEKLAQQIYNVLEKSYETFYHVVFLEVCKSYGITPIDFIYIYILFCCFHLYLVIEHFLMNYSNRYM